MNGLYPVQTKQMGAANLNTLVQDQLGTSSYAVVRNIYDNLQWLHRLFEQLPFVDQITQELHSISLIGSHIAYIKDVAKYIEDVIQLNNDLPLVQELAPRIEIFSTKLENVEEQIKAHNTNVETVKADLFDLQNNLEISINQYQKDLDFLLTSAKEEICVIKDEAITTINSGLKEVSEGVYEIRQATQLFHSTKERVQAIDILLDHLAASDAVHLAMFTKEKSDVDQARKLIRISEKNGTDENILRRMLNYREKPKHLGVLNALADNLKQIDPNAVHLAANMGGKDDC